ncbi:MAG: alpha-2-macroglobulin [Proteobacteria bacterium]|nr:alpha-2-macroglobulin [Pseudomonadota bacterium]
MNIRTKLYALYSRVSHRVSLLLNRIFSFIQSIIGKIQWTQPQWLGKAKQLACVGMSKAEANPKRFVILIVVILSAVVGLAALKHWYDHRPQPVFVTAQFEDFQIPAPSDEAQEPLNLSLKFVTEGGNSPQSVAPLQTKFDQPLTHEEVEISPEMTGDWMWSNDSSLYFKPKTDWKAGQKYTIRFKPEAFSQQAKFKKYQYVFTTPKLKPEIKNFQFYQDPRDPAQQSLVATIQFNYSIDQESLSKYLIIAPQNESRKKSPFTVTYAKQDRVAYIKTTQIKLPEEPEYYVLTIAKGLEAKNSKNALAEDVSTKLLLPNAGSMMKVKELNVEIVRNQKGTPEQVITVVTSLGVKTEELESVIRAYELPKDYPAHDVENVKKDYQWRSPNEVTSDILQQHAEGIFLTAIPAAHDHATLHGFNFHAKPGRYIYVTIANQLKGDGGYKLKDSYETILQAPEYPKETRFMHKGSLLALGSEHKLSLQVQGLSTVKYEVGRVLQKEINHLITQTYGNYDNPEFLTESFNKNDLSEVFTAFESFNNADPAKPQYTAIDLDKYLKPNAGNSKPLGLFLLKVQGWEKKQSNESNDENSVDDDNESNSDSDANGSAIEGTMSSRLILITDMALVVKKNQDNSRDVFISSITEAKPVSGSKVSILGRNGSPLVSGISDATGHVTFSALDPDKYSQDREPVVIVATHDNDISFIPYNRADREINYSRFDVGGIDDSDTGNLAAFIFSDRGIYRPGELAHLGFIIKKAYAQQAEAGIPIEIVITDPQGNTVKDQIVSLPPNGYFTQDFLTQEKSLTGTYNIYAYIVKDNQRGNYLGDAQILVRDFLPDTMKIGAEFSVPTSEGWISPEKLAATVKLANLYGTPSASHKVTGKITLDPRQFSFAQYAKYHFNNPLYNKDKPLRTVTEDLPEVITDANGIAQFNLDLTRFDKATYALRFYAQGFAKDSGRSVSTEISALVSPLTYLVGYKTDGDYSYIPKNSKNRISLLAINPQLKSIPLDKLQTVLIQENTVASLVEKESGIYQYQTITQEKVLKTESLKLPEGGMEYILPTDQVGHYILAIKSEEGLTLARIPFNVVGGSAEIVQKNTELTVTSDKQKYKPGDEIQLQITAPYTGSGLITIERDKVYGYQWFTATTPNSVQKIKIPADFVGNGYINVTYIRDWNSPEIFLNPLSYSVIPLNMDLSQYKVSIDLKAPAEIHAGKSISIQYQTNPASQIIVYAVDEGILRAGSYETPKPLDYFFQKRALKVMTDQIVDLILPKYISSREISSVGGDGGKKEMSAYLNPFKRKNTPPVAFWSGIMDATETPKTVEYQLPDSFNGTLRIMAVAADKNQVGSTEQSALVQNDFILNPNAPTFAAPGDSFDVAVNVTNAIKKSTVIPITVTVKESENLEIIGEHSQIVNLEDKQDMTVHFTVRAKDQLGNAEIQINAANDKLDKHSAQTVTLSVRPVTPFMTVLNSGYKKSGTVTLPVNDKLYAEKRSQTITAGNNPLIFITGLSQYLESYPYGCTEQLASRGFANLILQNIAELNVPDAKAQSNFEKMMGLILSRQNSDGSFSYWPGITDDKYLSTEKQFSSVYAMHLLTEARDYKKSVSKEAFERGMDYLKNLAGANTTDLTMARIQAYAIYVLTRNEIVTTNYVTNLQLYLDKNYEKLWKKDILSSYLASVYMLLHDEKTANELITGYHMGEKEPAYETFYGKDSRDAQYMYLLSKHFPARMNQMGTAAMIDLANNLSTNEVSTTTAAFDILALSNPATFTSKGPMNIEVFTNKGQMTEFKNENPSKSFPLANDIQKLVLGYPDRSGFFYQFSQSGFATNLPTKELRDGIEITHDYTDDQNHSIQQLKLGQEVTVHIKIRSLTSDSYPHIAIVDLLPGGFDVVPNSFNGNYLYYEAREDRVLFFGYVPNNDLLELTYRIKAAAPGEFIQPPAYAEDMYNSRIRAMSKSGKITIQ